MSKKKVTIQEAMDHADDIDVYSALQQFPARKTLTRSDLQNVYNYSHAAKNHQNVKPFVKRAGLSGSASLTQLIQSAIK